MGTQVHEARFDRRAGAKPVVRREESKLVLKEPVEGDLPTAGAVACGVTPPGSVDSHFKGRRSPPSACSLPWKGSRAPSRGMLLAETSQRLAPREPGTARDGLTWVPRALCTLPPLAPRTSAQETHSKGLLSDPGSVSTSSRSVALLHSGCRQPGGPRGRPVRGQFPPRRLLPEEPGRAQEWRASAAAPPRSNAFYPQVYRWILNTFPSPRPFLYSLKYFYWA